MPTITGSCVSNHRFIVSSHVLCAPHRFRGRCDNKNNNSTNIHTYLVHDSKNNNNTYIHTYIPRARHRPRGRCCTCNNNDHKNNNNTYIHTYIHTYVHTSCTTSPQRALLYLSCVNPRSMTHPSANSMRRSPD